MVLQHLLGCDVSVELWMGRRPPGTQMHQESDVLCVSNLLSFLQLFAFLNPYDVRETLAFTAEDQTTVTKEMHFHSSDRIV